MKFFYGQSRTNGKSVDNGKPYTIFLWKMSEKPMSNNAIIRHTYSFLQGEERAENTFIEVNPQRPLKHDQIFKYFSGIFGFLE